MRYSNALLRLFVVVLQGFYKVYIVTEILSQH